MSYSYINIAVTQRIAKIGCNEICDSLDQRWHEFLDACFLMPVLIPNNLQLAKVLIKNIPIQGFLFTGGNDLANCRGDAFKRDVVETFLLEHSMANNIPAIGVCRGMQLIQTYFGATLERVQGHIQPEQTIQIKGKTEKVNSFHNYGTRLSTNSLNAWAHAEDGIIKAVHHASMPIMGIMWHPERLLPFAQRDMKIFCEHFRGSK